MLKKLLITGVFLILLVLTVINIQIRYIVNANFINPLPPYFQKVNNTIPEDWVKLDPFSRDEVLVKQNDNYSLYLTPRGGEFTIFSNKTESVWNGLPKDRSKDPAPPIEKTKISAHLLVDFTNEAGISAESVNSFQHSYQYNEEKVDEFGNLTYSSYQEIYITDFGFRIIYTFPRQGFVVPVDFILTDYGYKLEVNLKSIQENPVVIEYDGCEDTSTFPPTKIKCYENRRYKITKISLLPYFNAGNPSDEGYVVVPDGSGALIEFTNKNGSYNEYNQPIYGRELALNKQTLANNVQKVSLPVYGIKNGNVGFLAVCSDGSEFATINALPGGKNTQYTTGYFSWELTQFEEIVMLEQNWDSRTVKIPNKNPYPLEKVSVSYYLLENDSADYVGMALKYRDILGLTNSEKNDAPLFIELYGAIKVKKTFLGIPWDRTIKLTTFEEVKQIADELNAYSDGLKIKYTGWNRDGVINNKLPLDAKINNSLGSSKEYKEMITYLNSNDIDYYANADVTNFYVNGNGIYKYFHATKGLSNQPAFQHSYLSSTARRNPNVRPSYLLSPNKFEDAINKYTNNYVNKYGNQNFAFDTLGETLYSNFGKNYVSRDLSIQYQINALKNSNIKSLSLYNPNAYLLPYVDNVYGVPVVSSNFDIFTRSIPFYQMIFTGSLDYASTAINQSDNPIRSFMKAIETGSGLSFSLYAADSYLLKDTPGNNLNNSNYDSWKDSIKKMYENYKEVKLLVRNQFIDEHEMLENDVFKTSYNNGVYIITNYNELTYQIYKDGKLVKEVDCKEILG